MREKYLLLTFIAGFISGRIIHTTDSLVLKLFALTLTFTIGTACAYAYEKEASLL
ncbi:hypothetical protein J7K27_02120 [Candidatus Bathyarchaeota archaeon]|nr:hypothetical protein [Candidatus Bathyarchaeota archaeon]